MLIHIDSFIEPDDDPTRKIMKNIANHVKGLSTKVEIRDKYLKNEAKINSELKSESRYSYLKKIRKIIEHF